MTLQLATGAFVAIFLAEFYLYGATASVYERYQPGINAVRLPFSPFLQLLVVGCISLALSLVPRLRRPAVRFASAVSLAGVASALVAVPLFIAIDRGFECRDGRPETRTVEATLRHSLTCPQLSNRSYAAPLYTAFLASVLLCLVHVRRPDPSEPAG